MSRAFRMASSRPVPAAGAPPPEGAPYVINTTPSERRPFKEVQNVAREATPSLPWDENSEAIILEHEEKVNRYQAVLTAYLKAKYFSTKASDQGGRSLQPQCAAVPEPRSRLPQANNSEAKDVAHEENWFIGEALDHEEKVNKYQAMLAARLKAKYFSSKTFDKEAKDGAHEENWFIGEALDHEEKVNKYQAMLAARLKAKYFSSKAFDKGLTENMFEEITIQSETIRMSRWPFTSLYADPAKNCVEKRST